MDNSQDTLLLQNQYDGIIEIILNRPDSKNSLSKDLIKTLRAKLRSLSNEDNVRCIIISSKGNVFCSGHDLKELSAINDVKKYEKIFSNCSKLMIEIQNQPQPVIAKVQGVASAAGCQLVASCDLAVASDKSKFITPGVDIGLFCSTPMVPISRTVSKKKALEMLYTGEEINAQTALSIGLINKVTSEKDLSKESELLAKKIASKSKKIIELGKNVFNKQINMSIEEAYNYTSKIMCKNMQMDQAKQGIEAFINKKTTKWNID